MSHLFFMITYVRHYNIKMVHEIANNMIRANVGICFFFFFIFITNILQTSRLFDEDLNTAQNSSRLYMYVCTHASLVPVPSFFFFYVDMLLGYAI